MKLLTAKNKKDLPALYTQDGKGSDAVAVVKFFDPSGRYTFYATEYDGEDTFFGYAVSMFGEDCDEYGYASLSEMQGEKGRFGLGIERDRHFTPRPLKELDLGL